MKYLDKVLITILSFLFALSMTWNVNGNTNLINFLVCFIVESELFSFAWYSYKAQYVKFIIFVADIFMNNSF